MASQLDLFVANTQRSEKVAEAFLSLDHSAEHNSGGSELTLDIRAQYVQFRDELQSKIVQLMAMYNSFSQYIGKKNCIVTCRFKLLMLSFR